MTDLARPTCKIIRPASTYGGKQGFDYFEGIAKETVGSTGICMHLLTIPPGGRARAHKHEHHETAIYVLKGSSHTWFGERLEECVVAVIARTDPNEQESVVLLPELDALVPA
jgi:uncharacterized RmlC-like cupin family protein